MNITTSGKSVAAREDEGTVVHVEDETGEKLYQDAEQTKPVTITIAGTYSSRYRRITDTNGDKAWKKRGGMDAADSRRTALETIAACILAWDGFTSDGEEFPLTKANAVTLLDACPWIRDKVEKAMTSHELFTAPVSLS